jgi:uncharacterized protein
VKPPPPAKPLIVHVEQIDASAQPWEGELSRQFLDEVLAGPPATEFHAGGLSRVHAELTKLGRQVLVRGRSTIPLEGQCKRCLRTLALPEPMEFTLTYLPSDDEKLIARAAAAGGDPGRRKQHKSGKDDEGPRASFDVASVDEEIYSGKEIDLGPALREQVLLHLPPSPLCKEECLGLCAVCGTDRNERECGHAQKPVDPRWSALQGIQLDKKLDKKE